MKRKTRKRHSDEEIELLLAKATMSLAQAHVEVWISHYFDNRHCQVTDKHGKQIDKSGYEHKDVCEVYFPDRGIECIPPDISLLVNIRRIELQRNFLRTLPTGFGALRNLIHVNFSDNVLEKIPAEFWTLDGLLHVKLGGNLLTDIPAGIVNLTNLCYLDISKNQIESLPAEMGQLTKLVRLYFGNNAIGLLPQSMTSLRKIDRLGYGENRFHEVLGGPFRLEDDGWHADEDVCLSALTQLAKGNKAAWEVTIQFGFILIFTESNDVLIPLEVCMLKWCDQDNVISRMPMLCVQMLVKEIDALTNDEYQLEIDEAKKNFHSFESESEHEYNDAE
jgi:hypothetical protein